MTEIDYKESAESLRVIAHIQDDLKPGGLVKFLEISAFVLSETQRIMFTKDGKPKSKVQVVLSIPAIIKFIRTVVRMINGETLKKRQRRIRDRALATSGDPDVTEADTPKAKDDD